jgi:enamine deaminase RidA (YjgF/YER057c/UK114 family)
MSAGSPRARLGQLGVALPQVVAPLASYVPAVRTGNLVYTSGQLPIEGGKLAGTGKVGGEISLEKGKALARICALNALAAVGSVVDIDAVARVVKVVGFVASHARSAVGVSELPLDAPVEVELIVEVG